MSDHKNLDFNRITDQIYIGSNACCQAHFDKQLIAIGIRADVSLEKERLEQPVGVDFFLWLPTVDHAPPTNDQIDAGVALLETFAHNDVKVYVHCKNGHGRAPTLTAAFLIKTRGLSVDNAIAFIKERRNTIHLQDAQMEFLRNYKLRLVK
jgi:protein-tyrosine phosphatase